MSEQRLIDLRRQQLDELSGAALRALAADSDLHYREGLVYRGERRLRVSAPHLVIAGHSRLQTDITTRRALADGLALRLCHSDPALHESLAPESAIERLMFDWLEQIRAESQVPSWMPGQRHNLRLRFERWSAEFEHSRQLENTVGQLLFTVTQVCWSRISGHPLDEGTADLVEGTRMKLMPTFGRHFTGLRRSRHDQALFSVPALAIARLTAQWAEAELQNQRAAAGQPIDDALQTELRSAFAILLAFESMESERPLNAPPSASSRVFEDAAHRYQVFTRQFDREVPAQELLRAEELLEYRNRLDALVQDHPVNLLRLARQLQTLLASPQRDGWNFGQDEGLIDGRRLSQIFSSPSERRVFKSDRLRPLSDCSFTVLIDCSGSMKAHMPLVAVLVDVLARALDMAGVDHEVLGFTTGGWTGGRARQAWQRAGSPKHPGRLNESLHMVFKPAELRWRHGKRALGALLKPDLFRESIDGEAVMWACERMLARDHRRRLLLVISDGCPMDTATQQANDVMYLDNHLRQVIRQFDNRAGVEILGLGVGLDLSVYYNRCVGIDTERKVDRALCDELVLMIAGRHRH